MSEMLPLFSSFQVIRYSSFYHSMLRVFQFNLCYASVLTYFPEFPFWGEFFYEIVLSYFYSKFWSGVWPSCVLSILVFRILLFKYKYCPYRKHWSSNYLPLYTYTYTDDRCAAIHCGVPARDVMLREVRICKCPTLYCAQIE